MQQTVPLQMQCTIGASGTWVTFTPQVSGRVRRVRAYTRPGEECPIVVEEIRIGNRRWNGADACTYPLEYLFDRYPAQCPRVCAGERLELHLRGQAGIIGPLSVHVIAFLDVEDEQYRRLEAEAARERGARRALEGELAEQRHVTGQLELQVVALRAELETMQNQLAVARRSLDDREAWRAELEERRRRRPVRAPALTVLVDQDVD